ncbi:MAG: carboxypeptidase-like regulatory domain-containing protein, partial [Vicinamibacterales bacterium]
MSRRLRVLLALACLLAAPVLAGAQQAGTLAVTVQDETKARLIHATVTLIDPVGGERTEPVDARGVATFANVAPGTWQVLVAADGFQPSATAVEVVRGANEALVQLSVAIAEDITVQETDAAARRDNGFTETLTNDQIEALSDDPDEMADQLAQMAGPGAQIFVDGFGGGRLPPK